MNPIIPIIKNEIEVLDNKIKLSCSSVLISDYRNEKSILEKLLLKIYGILADSNEVAVKPQAKVVDYSSIVSDDLAKHDKTVRKMIDEGWQLQGGLSITKPENGFTRYAQALIKVQE